MQQRTFRLQLHPDEAALSGNDGYRFDRIPQILGVHCSRIGIFDIGQQGIYLHISAFRIGAHKTEIVHRKIDVFLISTDL